MGFRAWGTDLADLFETAARAMFSLEYDVDSVPQQESPSVAVQGDDLEGALYAWLSELVWLHDAEGFALADVWVD
ncbi:MAG TPA: archease, partial [Actinomycetota bacterium]|nr:archease [Actinomycetota bacterium]